MSEQHDTPGLIRKRISTGDLLTLGCLATGTLVGVAGLAVLAGVAAFLLAGMVDG